MAVEQTQIEIDWDSVLLAWLHDPPDKALSIRGHVPRARDNAKIALGDDDLSRKKIEDNVAEVDPMAAIVERLPMPTAGDSGQHTVAPQGGRLYVIHPLSATGVDVPVPDLTEPFVDSQRKQLRSIVQNSSSGGQEHARNRFLGIWRLWPELLATHCDPCFDQLPADTRIPDHTIWNHLDVTAAFKAANADKADGGGAALLAFALGPVQQFIEAARSVRDLWSGSMILSWLAFRAMLPVIEQLGPTALVYPALRGNPLLDLWLRDPQRVGQKIVLPDVELRWTPALPHRFLALVPWGKDGACAKDLADQCKKAAADAWLEMARAVRQRLHKAMAYHCPDWDKRWDNQIECYFSTAIALVPLGGSGDEIDRQLAQLLTRKGSFKQAFSDAEAVRELARAIPASNRPGYEQDHAGRWQYQVELVQRSLAAQRSIRHVPPNPFINPGERFPQKCTLLGSFEQMGPDDLQQSKDFWDKLADSRSGLSIDGVRIRQGEALCAVALVKRFAGPAFLLEQLQLSKNALCFPRPAVPGRLAAGPQLQLSKNALCFPDTWTIAAAEWLTIAERHGYHLGPAHRSSWNGHWLHWTKRDDDLTDADECPADVFDQIREARRPDKCGAPPVYYAILKLDGDDLGSWLRGEKSPKVREVMHPTLVSYYEGLGEQAKAGLDAKRPVGPALHATISTALSNFALRAVPAIVRKHHGTTIYSGGDDTLVLLPVSQALACAMELRAAYMRDWWRADGNSGEENRTREYMMMGSRATLSGGLVIVHSKDDLRLALQDARRAEKQAKADGKDALVITVRRRSGEHTSALCPWEFAETVDNWRQQFAKGASDRWAYHLYAERTTLGQLPADAIRAEMRRQLDRAEPPTSSMIPPNSLVKAFDRLHNSSVNGAGGVHRRFPSLGAVLDAFLTLCHTASFMARGRDR